MAHDINPESHTKEDFLNGIKLDHHPKEVWMDETKPLEAPAKEFVPGPFYMSAEEIHPELADDSSESKADGQRDSGKEKTLAVDRRDFMRAFSGASLLAASSCIRRPVEKIIPQVKHEADQVVGQSVNYATTCGDCAAGCGIVVKTLDGRPTKIEGNPSNPISQGATCALGQSTLQGLYHLERLKNPAIKKGGKWIDVSWDDAYSHIGKLLSSAKKPAVFTHGSTGHRQDFLKEFLKTLGGSEADLYTYDGNQLSGYIAEAHRIAFGRYVVPRVDLRVAENMVGIGSDFLDVGVSSVYFSKSFAAGRALRNGTMTKLTQFESNLSLTGSKADARHVIHPGSETLVTMLLVRELIEMPNSKGSSSERDVIKKIGGKYTAQLDAGYKTCGVEREEFKKIAGELLGKPSVVMCGGSGNLDENATQLQLTAVMANVLIGAYRTTMFIDRGWMIPSFDIHSIKRFLSDAEKIDVLFIADSNPVFSLPESSGFKELLKKIPTVVVIETNPSAVDEFVTHRLPGNHFLESWGDEQPVAGFWSARQPVVRTMYDSRQAEDILLWVAAHANKSLPYKDYRTYIHKKWAAIHESIDKSLKFDDFFDLTLRRGFVGKLDSQSVGNLSDFSSSFILNNVNDVSSFVLVSALDVRLLDGRGSNRPILQEVGDSLTTIAWDSWVAMNPNTAKEMGLKRNDLVMVKSQTGSYEAGLFPMPGLHPKVIATPRGNGHSALNGQITENVGVNPLNVIGKRIESATGNFITTLEQVSVTKTGKKYSLASMQKHNDIANRKDIVKKISVADAAKNLSKAKDLDTVPDLYPKLVEGDYRWGMSIDLTKCTGCSACMVACSQENNIPQVGRQQILIGREMHWVRLDRYFYGSSDHPQITFQPMMCQHCNHAPCEAVCPVFATTHDPEGYNGQTYNRCVGTRYCANACPYKVRRFNWFTFKWGVIGDAERDRNIRALNPDVTVRTRGIMEKCTFCVQRIREAKHNDKYLGMPLREGTIKTACQQVCPSDAIVFGNLKDQNSRVSRARKDHRAFLSLGGAPDHGHYGIKTLPNVNYLAELVHELEDSTEGKHHE